MYKLHFRKWKDKICYYPRMIIDLTIIYVIHSIFIEWIPKLRIKILLFADICWESSPCVVITHVWYVYAFTGIILGMGSANERRRYYVTPSLICRAHTQNAPWFIHSRNS